MRIMLNARPRLCPYFGKWLVEGAVGFDYGDHLVWQSFYSQADFDSAKDALTSVRFPTPLLILPASSNGRCNTCLEFTRRSIEA